MLKNRDDEIGFIGLVLILCYLVNGWESTMRLILGIGGIIVVLFVANLFFDLVDKIKKRCDNNQRKKGTK